MAMAAGMAADTAPDLDAAMPRVTGPARVLVAGSLHLVGQALARSGAPPT
jgi:folylpolyglutamate synthase/dihydropteroate synthase